MSLTTRLSSLICSVFSAQNIQPLLRKGPFGSSILLHTLVYSSHEGNGIPQWVVSSILLFQRFRQIPHHGPGI